MGGEEGRRIKGRLEGGREGGREEIKAFRLEGRDRAEREGGRRELDGKEEGKKKRKGERVERQYKSFGHMSTVHHTTIQ